MKKIHFYSDLESPHEPLEPDALQLWIGTLEAQTPDLLLPEEKKRVQAYRFAIDGLHFAQRRSLLRRLLSSYLNRKPFDILFQEGPSGKPYLKDSPIQFSMSRSDEWVALVFGLGEPLGVDIEVIRELAGMEAIIFHCFSPREKAFVAHEKRVERFWQVWNRKEAVIKALGVGVQGNLTEWDCLGPSDAMHWSLLKEKDAWIRSLTPSIPCSLAIAIKESDE